jgi:hypothetical protein
MSTGRSSSLFSFYFPFYISFPTNSRFSTTRRIEAVSRPHAVSHFARSSTSSYYSVFLLHHCTTGIGSYGVGNRVRGLAASAREGEGLDRKAQPRIHKTNTGTYLVTAFGHGFGFDHFISRFSLRFSNVLLFTQILTRIESRSCLVSYVIILWVGVGLVFSP